MDPAILADADAIAKARYAQQFSQGVQNPQAAMAAKMQAAEAAAMGAGGNPPNPAAGIPGGVQPPGAMSQSQFSGYGANEPLAVQKAKLLMKLRALQQQEAMQGAPAGPANPQMPPSMPSLPMSGG